MQVKVSNSFFALSAAFSSASQSPGVHTSFTASYFQPTPFTPAISMGSPTTPEPSTATKEWQDANIMFMRGSASEHEVISVFTAFTKLAATQILSENKKFKNLNLQIDPKGILNLPRGFTYKIVPIKYFNRKKGKAKFKIKELGSSYLFTLLYCFLEKILLNKKFK